VAASEGLLDDVATVVVKHGAGGAERQTGGRTVSHPGYPVDPVDTTGAGDAFAAGFIAGRFEGDDESTRSPWATPVAPSRRPGQVRVCR